MKHTAKQLREAILAIVQLPILEWRRGYGDSGSFHVGAWSPGRHRRTARQRGTWIITVWEAGVRLTLADAETVQAHPPLALGELALEQFVGQAVESAKVTDAGTLTLQLASHAKIEVIPVPDVPSDADQWVLETPGLGAFVVRSGPVFIQEPPSLAEEQEPNP
jgi:hypothetical protein